jgi:hypothetical protein
VKNNYCFIEYTESSTVLWLCIQYLLYFIL